MKVSRIEIFGFKSFLEKVVLPLDQGITAIVGPNGCGKSNLVDALRWVFGETRASQLRGSLLEDVIFNGTETLRPLGLAEVSLVISTDKESLKEDILANRYRHSSKNTEGAGIQTDTSEISQEKVESESDEESAGEEEKPSGKPQLVVIDGALSHKQSEATADHKEVDSQNSANTNLADADDESSEDPALTRFGWLKLSREVEVTRRLYRSGESEFFINKVACRLRDMKELFRLLGLGARSYTLVAQGEVSRIITSKPEERRLMIEEAAGVSGVRERLALAERRLEETKQNVARLNDLIAEVTRQVNSLRVQASRAKNRAELKLRLKTLDSAIVANKLETISARSQTLKENLQHLLEKEQLSTQELEVSAKDEEAVQKELLEYQTRREEISREVRRARSELNLRTEQRSALVAELQSLEQKLQSQTQLYSDLDIKQINITQQVSNAEEELEQFIETRSSLELQLSSLDKVRSGDLEEAARELDSERSKLFQLEKQARESESACQTLNARLEATEEQLVNLNRYNTSSASSEDFNKPEFADLAPLLEHVHAPDYYRRALEAALLVYPDLRVCADLSRIRQLLLAEPAIGQNCRQILAIGQSFSSSACLELDSEIKPLLAVLEISDQYREVVSSLFRNFYLAENLEQAYSIVDRYGAANQDDLVIVTVNGELVTSNSIGFGKEQHGSVELYARKRELASVLAVQKDLCDQNQTEFLAHKEIVEAAQSKHALALNKAHEAEKEIREKSSELGAVKGKMEVVSRLVSQLLQERQQIQQAISRWAAEKEQMICRISEIGDCLSTAPQSEPVDQETIDSLEQNLDASDARCKELIESLESRSKNKDAIRIKLEDTVAQRSKTEFEIEKFDLEAQTVRQRFEDSYPEDMQESLLKAEPLSSEELISFGQEAERLRSRLMREGEVDPGSIILFEQEEQRLTELKEQRADLESAADTLGATVIELNELSKRRFLETFKIVQDNFANFIPKVFGGGYGALILENRSDPFEGGIDVHVRPPGKKPKSIELLSGGERALCAIALIFSMFLHKPSPLCVLDEVDAPLDDANLKRYVMMLKDMSSVTQFVVITHNKEAMAAADRLVGVTQEQPGASRVVTVSLEQAQAVVG